MKNETLKKIVWTALAVVVVALLGALFVSFGNEWFNNVNKPLQWIPNYVFPIVWTIIYFVFTVIMYDIYEKKSVAKDTVILGIINGVLNIVWCLLFFTLRLTFVGLIVIILNALFAYALWYSFYRRDKRYGYAFSIYPIWLTVAAFLNAAVWILN